MRNQISPPPHINGPLPEAASDVPPCHAANLVTVVTPQHLQTLAPLCLVLPQSLKPFQMKTGSPVTDINTTPSHISSQAISNTDARTGCQLFSRSADTVSNTDSNVREIGVHYQAVNLGAGRPRV